MFDNLLVQLHLNMTLTNKHRIGFVVLPYLQVKNTFLVNSIVRYKSNVKLILNDKTISLLANSS